MIRYFVMVTLAMFTCAAADAMPRPISKIGSFTKTVALHAEQGATFVGHEAVHGVRFAGEKSKDVTSRFVSHVRGR
jgi:hypothetical protein